MLTTHHGLENRNKKCFSVYQKLTIDIFIFIPIYACALKVIRHFFKKYQAHVYVGIDIDTV